MFGALPLFRASASSSLGPLAASSRFYGVRLSTVDGDQGSVFTGRDHPPESYHALSSRLTL